jgi:transcriptional regulator with XRE-family HTH domain
MYVVDLRKIRMLRKARGISQADLSSRLGYKTGLSYHNLEKGKYRMAADQLARIADILQVPICDLYTEAVPKTGTETNG